MTKFISIRQAKFLHPAAGLQGRADCVNAIRAEALERLAAAQNGAPANLASR